MIVGHFLTAVLGISSAIRRFSSFNYLYAIQQLHRMMP
jgi:hypothetical protein